MTRGPEGLSSPGLGCSALCRRGRQPRAAPRRPGLGWGTPGRVRGAPVQRGPPRGQQPPNGRQSAREKGCPPAGSGHGPPAAPQRRGAGQSARRRRPARAAGPGLPSPGFRKRARPGRRRPRPRGGQPSPPCHSAEEQRGRLASFLGSRGWRASGRLLAPAARRDGRRVPGAAASMGWWRSAAAGLRLLCLLWHRKSRRRLSASAREGAAGREGPGSRLSGRAGDSPLWARLGCARRLSASPSQRPRGAGPARRRRCLPWPRQPGRPWPCRERRASAEGKEKGRPKCDAPPSAVPLCDEGGLGRGRPADGRSAGGGRALLAQVPEGRFVQCRELHLQYIVYITYSREIRNGAEALKAPLSRPPDLRSRINVDVRWKPSEVSLVC